MGTHIHRIPDINKISIPRTALMAQYARSLGYHTLESAIVALTWHTFDTQFAQWAKDKQFTKLHSAQEQKGSYDHKLRFAKSLGYKNISEAISDLGSYQFLNKYKAWDVK